MKKIVITLATLLFGLSAFPQLKTTPQQRAYWNGFVDFITAKGFQGSPALDRRDLKITQKLFSVYNRMHGKWFDYTGFVTLVQRDIIEYRTLALKQIRISRVKHNQNPGYPVMFTGPDSKFMAGLSQLDGFAGVKTTSYKFPAEQVLNTPDLRFNDVYVSN